MVNACIIHIAGERFARFNELQPCIPDISQKMLTATLRTLEEDVASHQYAYSMGERKHGRYNE